MVVHVKLLQRDPSVVGGPVDAHDFEFVLQQLDRRQDAIAIKSIPNVVTSMPDIQGNNTVRYGDIDYQTAVTATTTALPATRSWPVARGVFFSDEDQAGYETVAVLGDTVREALFPDGEDPIGKYVLIKNVPFQVIGVMSAKGSTSGGQDTDDVIFVPLTTGMTRVFGQRFVRSITIAVNDLSKMDAVQVAVTNLLKERHNGATDFRIRNMADIVETATEAQNSMTILLGSVAAISLLVGGIGIMNIMLASITERIREIGIRKAIGATFTNVFIQILVESVVLAALGGMMGLAASYGIVHLLTLLSPTENTPIITVESNFEPRARSQKDARGLMQLIPKTASRFKVSNPYDIKDNLRGGLEYLRWLLAYFQIMVFESFASMMIEAHGSTELARERKRDRHEGAGRAAVSPLTPRGIGG
jgi:ABC-type antimicrobial peptide transport system permease subunit